MENTFLANLELWLLEQAMEQGDPDGWYAQEWEKYQGWIQKVPTLPALIGTKADRERGEMSRQQCYEHLLWRAFLEEYAKGHKSNKLFLKGFLADAKYLAGWIRLSMVASLWMDATPEKIESRFDGFTPEFAKYSWFTYPLRPLEGEDIRRAEGEARWEEFMALYPHHEAAYAVYTKRELTWFNHVSLLENIAEGFGPYDAFLRIKRAYEYHHQSLQKLCYIHEQLYQCKKNRAEIEDASHWELRAWFPTTYIPDSDSYVHADVQDTVKYSEHLTPSHEQALDFCRRYYDSATLFLEEIIAELAATQTEKAEE